MPRAARSGQLLDHRQGQAGGDEDQDVEEAFVQRSCPRVLVVSSDSAMVGSRHTQSRQSIFFRSANWLGCLTRKQDRQTNSPGCLGSTRSTPSAGAVLGLGGVLVVLGLLDDQPFLQDGVQAGLDVLVVGLLLFVLVRLLAGLGRLGRRLGDGDGRSSSSSTTSDLDVVVRRRRWPGRLRQSGRRRRPAHRGLPRSVHRVLRLRRVLVASRSFRGELGGSIDGSGTVRSHSVGAGSARLPPDGTAAPVSRSRHCANHAGRLGYSRPTAPGPARQAELVSRLRPSALQVVRRSDPGVFGTTPPLPSTCVAGLGEVFSTRSPGPPSASHSIPPSSRTVRSRSSRCVSRGDWDWANDRPRGTVGRQMIFTASHLGVCATSQVSGLRDFLLRTSNFACPPHGAPTSQPFEVLGAEVDVRHGLGQQPVPGLLGDEPVHLLGHPAVARRDPGAPTAARGGAWPRGRSSAWSTGCGRPGPRRRPTAPGRWGPASRPARGTVRCEATYRSVRPASATTSGTS